nr:hypothetical protein [Massilia eurypsychrophila]
MRHQTAAALFNDMAVTSPVYPDRSCTTDPAGCAAAGAQKGISEGCRATWRWWRCLLSAASPAAFRKASHRPKS